MYGRLNRFPPPPGGPDRTGLVAPRGVERGGEAETTEAQAQLKNLNFHLEILNMFKFRGHPASAVAGSSTALARANVRYGPRASEALLRSEMTATFGQMGDE